MSDWLLLILTLPTANTNVRMRAWRALKNAGAAVLRDGVYLLPENEINKDIMVKVDIVFFSFSLVVHSQKMKFMMMCFTVR